MATEQRLRDELNQAAQLVTSDTSAALARVVRTTRRRRRVRRTGLAVGAAIVVAAGAVAVPRFDLHSLDRRPDPANHSTQPRGINPPPNGHELARTALTGAWQSVAYPSSRVRAAITEAGLGSGAADQAIGSAREWRVQLRFSNTSGFAGLVVETSDPTQPGSSLQISETYVYRLLPDHRLLVTSTHPATRTTLSYRLSGGRLRLHLLSSETAPADDRAAARWVSWTFAPLTLVH